MKVTYSIKQSTKTLEEPQIAIRYSALSDNKLKSETLNVLSLFSGCGGMDLGFEGGFSIPSSCINEKLRPISLKKSYQKSL